MVTNLVKKQGADINFRMVTQCENKIEGTSLLLAMRKGDWKLVQLLCKELGADVNAGATLEGRPTTLLHFATLEMIE